MLRIVLVAVLLAITGCDAFGSDDSPFVGSWEGGFVEETRVVSTIDQRYLGTDGGTRGIGAIEVSGPVRTSFRYFSSAPRGSTVLSPRFVSLEDRDGFSALLQAGGNSYVANKPDRPDHQLYDIRDVLFSVDLATRSVTIPRTVVQTDDGPLTIEGTLTGRPVDLRAGVEAELPRFYRTTSDSLVVSSDGTYIYSYFTIRGERGTWEADGDTLVLTPTSSERASSHTFTLVDGELRSYRRVDDPISDWDLQNVERFRHLQQGSLEAATTTYVYVYERID